ncbi:GNAT family N-acetyltransferase [Rhodovarius crocodyli]|uniref:GNAT family N-acetyltransferase n=1 Tax=Rhodovarius crocodyli TaxID=1979269 RepID=UPI001F0C93E5|nr:GNAT family N-acetyltransferase [Rhodovarius crocodyli]
MIIRAGLDADTAHYIRLIGDAWAEFPGVVFDVDAELPELRHLASWFEGQGGRVWLADGPDGVPLGMVGVRPHGSDQAWEICRMYVDKAARGTGVAHRLLDQAEAHAREQGAERLILWTDTRFMGAHKFYEKRGFVRQGAIRILDDLSKSLEFRYAKPLSGLVVDILDAAAATSAELRLAEILTACVEDGAAIPFLPPMPKHEAQAYWRRTSSEVAAGDRILLAAWYEGQITGAVQLRLAMPPSQQHRAEIEMLLVHPQAQRLGIGRHLLGRAEQSAERLGRRLLTLQTRTGDKAEAAYRALGWVEGGRIPGYALDAAGGSHDGLFLYRQLPG